MNSILAETITIGDEILYGQTLDTNSHWISGALDEINIKIIRKTTIADRRDEILNAFAEAENRADIILITGGLGPTNDDLTKPCLAEYFDSELVMHEEALHEIEDLFRMRGRELNELNRQQAMLPDKCTKITNKFGTAPGMWFTKGDKVFVSMPGVPYEMKKMMESTIIPKIQEQFHTPPLYHKIIKTAGIGESWLSERIKDWEDNLPEHIKLAYLPSLGQVKLRLTATGQDLISLEKEVQELIDQLLPLAGEFVYGFDDDELEEVIGRMLKERNMTLAMAESCTGGFVSHKITSVAGSSKYYQGGIVPYSNENKVANLGVREETIQQFGAVSEETVIEMAERVREKYNASIGISTSGIAGPTGGTDEKPVGTVWIGYADGKRSLGKKLKLTKDRMLNIQITEVALLNWLRQRLIEND